MSSAPASVPSSSASSEAFAQSSTVSHGVSDLFQSLHLGDQGSRRRQTQKREMQSGKNGILNPFAKEFTPVTGRKSGPVERQLNQSGGQQKGPKNGTTWRSKLGDKDILNQSVSQVDELNGLGMDNTVAGSSLATSGGGLSSAFGQSGGNGQTEKRSSGRISAGQGSGSSTHTTGNMPSGSRRAQFLNGNHLLNFHYDPIPRLVRRAPSARRPQKVQPYNKELFLQANFRFLVSDLGDYFHIATDPDKMLQWEDVAAVGFSPPVPVQCPICLDSPPLCSQITTCGHIFCLPCILRYLMTGNLDDRGDHWKKCPLCFAMIHCKDLRTVLMDNVKQHSVGEKLNFTLLVRAKGSIIPFEKDLYAHGPLAYSKDGQCHLFSKLTLTSDAEPTANRAIEELTSWAKRAQLHGGEDLDLLPYVFAGVDQLQQRKVAWTEHRTREFLSSSPPVRQRILTQAKLGSKLPVDHSLHSEKKVDSEVNDILLQTEAAITEMKESAGWVYESAFSDDENDGIVTPKLKGQVNPNLVSKVVGSGHNVDGTSDDWEDILGEPESGEYGGETTNEDLLVVGPSRKDQDGKKKLEERDSYTFYQSADGQTIILHPLNVKCLLHHYGSYELLPLSLEAEIVELETITQTDSTRKRYRYLSHLPLTANFQLCEVDLAKLLPSRAFTEHAEELRVREARRRRVLKQEMQEKALEERAAAAGAVRLSPPSLLDFSTEMTSSQMSEVPMSADFVDVQRILSAELVSPPEVEERKRFSQVAKLGFAAGCDSPDISTAVSPSPPSASSPWASGASLSKVPGMSFADIIQSQGNKVEVDDGPGNSSQSGPKKGKKASKIIMSTAGRRRY